MANSKVLGYARVSTKEQNEDRQLIALKEFGVSDEDVFVEKQSGKDFNRAVYQSLVGRLERGDVLVVKSIDRLGRDYEEIIEQWRLITKEINADIVVLDMELLDTRKKGRDLTGTLVADIVLQLLSYVAETERQNTLTRQAEGIAAAKAKGVKFGRPPLERPALFDTLAELWRSGELSAREGAKQLGVSRPTFQAWLDTE